MKNPVAISLLLSSACTADAPATPSFQVDVMPILAANCVRCHGYPAIGGSPDVIRYDSLDPVVVRDGTPRTAAQGECGLVPIEAQGVVCGAASRAGTMKFRVTAEIEDDFDNGQMPPRFPLEDFQIETIGRWADQGGLRGAPRPNNKPPTITVEPVGVQGSTLTFAIAIADGDHDLVVGELYARGIRQDFVGPLRSGHLEITWDTRNVPRGSIPRLVARLDDGAGFVEYDLGEVDLP